MTVTNWQQSKIMPSTTMRRQRMLVIGPDAAVFMIIRFFLWSSDNQSRVACECGPCRFFAANCVHAPRANSTMGRLPSYTDPDAIFLGECDVQRAASVGREWRIP